MPGEAFYATLDDGPLGRRYAVWHAPGAVPKGLIVQVPPFAEEMNKSRRMTALAAQAMVSAGWAVLRLDLLGCGDSDGDLSDASWSAWLDDIGHACRIADERAAAFWPHAAGLPRILWGHRAGSLLAAHAAATWPAWGQRLVLWQPQPAGRQVMQQFIRLRIAAAMQGDDAKLVGEQLRADLAAGRTVDVAGYRLPAALAASFETTALEPPPQAGQALWFELQAREGASLLPATAAARDRWAGAGWAVDAQVLQGPAFWMTVEVEESAALVDATVAALDRWRT